MLRSTDHVCKCKERDHPHPTPPQPHPTPNFLRSINHVGKFKERDYPPAPPMSTPGEPPVPRVICSWSYIYFFPLPTNGRNHSLNHWGCSFKYEVPLFSAQSISYLDIGCCYMLVSGSTNTQFNIMYHPIKSICIYIYITSLVGVYQVLGFLIGCPGDSGTFGRAQPMRRLGAAQIQRYGTWLCIYYEYRCLYDYSTHFYTSHTISVWYIYLYLIDLYGKCREIFHTKHRYIIVQIFYKLHVWCQYGTIDFM